MKRTKSQANITVTAGPPAQKRRRSTKGTRFPRNGVSETARARLKYACEVQLNTTGSSVLARHVFALNGLFDPDNTGVGLQSPGFDEWMTLYNLYTVTGGKVKVTPVNSTVNAAAPTYFAFGVSDAAILAGQTIQSMISASGNTSNKAMPFSPVGIHKGFQTTAEVGMSRSVKWSAKDIMGVKTTEQILNRSGLQGNISSNPSDLIYGTLCVGDCAGGIASQSPYHLVEIEFDVIFTNPKQLLMS